LKVRKCVFLIVIILLVVAAFLAGSWHRGEDRSATGVPAGKKILYYVDPVNPQRTSGKPGMAPCGMNMEPVYGDDVSVGGSPMAVASLPPGSVRVSVERQQMVGVRIGIVKKRSETRKIRTVGRVVPDETRVYRLNASVEGWIVEAGNNSTGSIVNKGDVLGSFCNLNFYEAQQACIYAFRSLERFQRSGSRASEQQLEETRTSLRRNIDNLRSLGMSDVQMEELKRSRKAADNLNIIAPVTGLILARNVSPDLRFDKGVEWYRIADLSRVWILADLFENEPYRLGPGTKVAISLPSQKKALTAVVSAVPPQFDAASRTLKVRLEADNPDYLLRPDMFVDVEFSLSLPPAITVPGDAVLDAGVRKTVFVDRGNGFFEPRRVEVGWRYGDRVEITSGLTEGERIVVSGNFLIDSESRMRASARLEEAGIDGPAAPAPAKQ
jgi:RND family efflux transporter MFP subunit